MSEWISVEEKLPPQNWSVIVKNGKNICNHATYHYKKWYNWDRKLYKVTHWKYFPNDEPKIPVADLKAFMKRAKELRHQMQPKNFYCSSILL